MNNHPKNQKFDTNISKMSKKLFDQKTVIYLSCGLGICFSLAALYFGVKYYFNNSGKKLEIKNKIASFHNDLQESYKESILLRVEKDNQKYIDGCLKLRSLTIKMNENLKEIEIFFNENCKNPVESDTIKSIRKEFDGLKILSYENEKIYSDFLNNIKNYEESTYILNDLVIHVPTIAFNILNFRKELDNISFKEAK